MILQNIIFPKKSICNKEILYYRQEKGKTRTVLCKDLNNQQEKSNRESLVIEERSVCSFFTYFNGFSIGKWKEYTDVTDFQINLFLEGKGEVYLCHAILDDDTPKGKILKKTSFEHEQPERLSIKIPQNINKGIIYVKILTKNKVIFYSGCYETIQKAVNKIRIAIGICTFQREEYVKKTLETFSTAFLNNEHSLLYGNLKVYISDNGKTLDCDSISGESVLCVHNKNAGGAGGFTRCMIEALREQEEQKYTHFLFMDDDILIEPEVLYRTYTLLSMADEKYKNATIGGALLRKDFMEIQHVSGENWNYGKIQSPKKGYDLSKKYYLLANEKITKEEYNGWWYCCIPFSVQLSKSLPLPVFIHRDDIEYNIRHSKEFMHLNGIGIWHDAFDNRRASNLYYYDIRNMFIINAIHKPEYSWKNAEKSIFTHMVTQLLRYRYSDVDLIIRALTDFSGGVNFLKTHEPVELHQNIMEMGYKFEDVSKKLDKYSKGWRNQDLEKKSLYNRKKFKLYHIILLNGWLLPGKNKVSVFPMGVPICDLFWAKRVLYYEPETGKGFETERNYKELLNLIKNMYIIHCKISKVYDKAAKDYHENYRELTSIEFWKKYLNIE